MKLLLDANVLLDTALHREPFAEDSDRVIQWCQESPHSAVVAWHSISNLYYLLRSAQTDAKAREFIGDLLRFTDVVSGGSSAVSQALALPLGDFEDALQVVAGLAGGAEFIVSRDIQHFRRSPLQAMTPTQFCRKLRAR